MKPTFSKDATIGDLYRPAMAITGQAEADDYFAALVEFGMSHGQTRERAEEIQRANLGYFAGYYNNETRIRVERLFNCAHPIFGAIAEKAAPTPEEAVAAGMRMATEA